MAFRLAKHLVAVAVLTSVSSVGLAQDTAQPDSRPAEGTTSMAAAPTFTKKSFNFTILPGKKSPAIVPPVNTPVSITAVSLSPRSNGVASATLLSLKGKYMMWTGLSSPRSANIESTFGGNPGDHILWLDFFQYVDLQAASLNSFYVSNRGTEPANVKITMTY